MFWKTSVQCFSLSIKTLGLAVSHFHTDYLYLLRWCVPVLHTMMVALRSMHVTSLVFWDVFIWHIRPASRSACCFEIFARSKICLHVPCAPCTLQATSARQKKRRREKARKQRMQQQASNTSGQARVLGKKAPGCSWKGRVSTAMEVSVGVGRG